LAYLRSYEIELELEEWIVDDESNLLHSSPESLAVSLWDALRALCFSSAKDTSDLSLIEGMLGCPVLVFPLFFPCCLLVLALLFGCLLVFFSRSVCGLVDGS
jgi:hypothetical protein